MGIGRIRFTAELLQETCLGLMMPRTYRLVGSEKSEFRGDVVLLFESADIADDVTVDMRIEVKDSGSTRTIVVRPIA